MTLRLFGSTAKILSPLPQQRVLERFIIAVVTAMLAVLVRGLLDPLLGHVAFYVTVYIAVTFCAVVCGLVPAILGALVGFLGIFYWFIDPRHSLSLIRPSEIHGIIGFVLVSAVLTALGVANRKKQMALDATIQALTEEAQERMRAEKNLQQAHDQLEQHVRDRTAELSRALSNLKSEMQERKRAEDQLRHLSLRLMTSQDEERRRIARELHDSAGQTLAAVKMAIASIQFSTSPSSELTQPLSDLSSLVDNVLQEIRTASYLLHPPLLDEVGISSAARWFVEGFAKRSGITVRCDIPDTIERPSRLCELVLFRVLQESLTNVHRHSKASEAQVSLRRSGQQLELEVRDNGVGIPKNHPQETQGKTSEGVGIAGMRERVRELGGRIEVSSEGTGTTVCATLPVPQSSNSYIHELTA